MKTYHVYMLASDRNGTIYIGVTGNLAERIQAHKMKSVKGFTTKYSVNKLVYAEEFDDISFAIQREKRLKEWPRAWKIKLIKRNNPYWVDLSDSIAA